ncbi:MAG: class I SAM-dependent methyltransferase [Polyangiales bacterium]
MNAAGPRSNSFNYTLVRAVGDLRGDTHEGCPVYRVGPRAWPRETSLFVRRGARVGLFQTRTTDFSASEVDRVARALGQVYVDVSQKSAPDDFSADLRKLFADPRCASCPARASCAGLWAPSLRDVFGEDDARVREALSGLTGSVIDVGCGQGPYGDILEGRVREGLRYVGVDPDAAHVAALRARWPWAELRVGDAESLSGEDRFDHALVLRSWNHFRDPDAAVRAIAGLLRPGGTLTVVDNVAFGLVRTREQAQRAEGGPSGFEHYRNDGADEALAVIARAAPALRCVERRPITPEGSNQWLVRAVSP